MNRRDRRAAPPAEDYRWHHNQAEHHRRAGRLVEAERHYRRTAELRLEAGPLINWGNALLAVGQASTALEAYQTALVYDPDLPQVRYGIGCALLALRSPEAALAFAEVIARTPGFLPAHERLVEAHLAAGAIAAACRAACAALAVVDTPMLRAGFLASAMQADPATPGLRPVLLRALRERWQRPQELAPAVCALLAAAPIDPGDDLLLDLLAVAPVCHPALEAALIAAQRGLSAPDQALANALARQAWINEGAWAGAEPNAALLPPDLVAQQIEEARLRPRIPVLTAIDDVVSTQVRAQYEANPYPRWVALPAAPQPTTYAAWLARRFPGATPPRKGRLDVLVAGCGTGQHPLELRQAFSDVAILAIDLSLASLAYAARMAASLGLADVAFAQADLLRVAQLGRRFDVIESSGVLHHLADLWAGWRALLGVLRPGGVMAVSLYTERGRDDVRQARAWIADQGYAPTPDGIRACRRDLMALPHDWARRLAHSPDFASLSGCRDMLFHVHEATVTLPQIAAFLAAEKLDLLGLDAPPATRLAFEAWNGGPGDLAAWDRFEAEHPTSLAGMVHVWVQKRLT